MFITSVVMIGNTREDSSRHQRPSDQTRSGRSRGSFKGDEVESVTIFSDSVVSRKKESTTSRIPFDVDGNREFEIEFVLSESVTLFDENHCTTDVTCLSSFLIELKKREDEHCLLSRVVERDIVDVVVSTILNRERTFSPSASINTSAFSSFVELTNSNIRKAEGVVTIPRAAVSEVTFRFCCDEFTTLLEFIFTFSI